MGEKERLFIRAKAGPGAICAQGGFPRTARPTFSLCPKGALLKKALPSAVHSAHGAGRGTPATGGDEGFAAPGRRWFPRTARPTFSLRPKGALLEKALPSAVHSAHGAGRRGPPRAGTKDLRPRAADGFRARRGPPFLCAQRAHFLKKRFQALYIPRTARDEGARRGRGREFPCGGRGLRRSRTLFCRKAAQTFLCARRARF